MTKSTLLASLSVLNNCDDLDPKWALWMKWTLVLFDKLLTPERHTPPPAPRLPWVAVSGRGWSANEGFSDLSLMQEQAVWMNAGRPQEDRDTHLSKVTLG